MATSPYDVQGIVENLPAKNGTERSCAQKVSDFVYAWMSTLTVSFCVVGVLIAIICKSANASPETIKVIRWPGELFVRALKVIVVPMIFASMVSNSARIGAGSTNKMVSYALRFYLSTTCAAAVQGIILFNIFQFAFTVQDVDASEAESAHIGEKLSILDMILQVGRDLVPDNLVKSMLETKILGVITFAIFFGRVLAELPRNEIVVDFFSLVFDALVAMIRKVIFFTPIGVGSLVAGNIAGSDEIGESMGNLGKLLAVVLLGQAIHVFGFYGATYAAFTKRNPLRFYAAMPKMWMTAFGTSSSAATLSTTCKTCLDFGISPRAVNFVCPIGCTVNMDGSALERPIVVMWIAHLAGQGLPFGQQLVVALISALMSIGASPIPSPGVTSLVLMVDAAGVNMTAQVEMLVALCLAIEWLLDSVRTAVNVTGDAIGVAVVDHLVGGDMDQTVCPATSYTPENIGVPSGRASPYDPEGGLQQSGSDFGEGPYGKRTRFESDPVYIPSQTDSTPAKTHDAARLQACCVPSLFRTR